MAKKSRVAKQQRLEAQAKSTRMRRIRIIGIVAIILIGAAAFVIWRNAGRIPADDATALVLPNRIGAADAPVKIVEFGDFGCHACRGWHNAGIKAQLLAAYGEQISFEFRHFPVITPQSPQAAEAGQCAAEQGRFWEFHDYIYEQIPEGALSSADLKTYATAVNLDRDAFDSCLENGRFEELVRADWRAAQNARARGTPTFLINGQQVFPTYNGMVEAIEAELN